MTISDRLKSRKAVEQKIAAEKEAFSLVLLTCRKAFDMRQPDALERTERYMSYYADCARGAKDPLWEKEYKRRARQMAALLAEFANRNLNNPHAGPSPFAKAKPEEHQAVFRLWEAGHLNDDHLRAARHIAKIYEAVSAAVMAKSRTLDGARSGPPGAFADVRLPEKLAWDHAHLYLPWAREMHKRADIILPLVIEVVALDQALDKVRREHHIGFQRALKMVQIAVDDFSMRCEAYSGISRARG